jgi:hypothetical protein
LLYQKQMLVSKMGERTQTELKIGKKHCKAVSQSIRAQSLILHRLPSSQFSGFPVFRFLFSHESNISLAVNMSNKGPMAQQMKTQTKAEGVQEAGAKGHAIFLRISAKLEGRQDGKELAHPTVTILANGFLALTLGPGWALPNKTVRVSSPRVKESWNQGSSKSVRCGRSDPGWVMAHILNREKRK